MLHSRAGLLRSCPSRVNMFKQAPLQLRAASVSSTPPPTASTSTSTSTSTFSSSSSSSSSDLHVSSNNNSNPASRPYARHRPSLPNPKSFKVPAIAFILFSVSSWTAFTIHATNRERLSSSVLKNVMEKIKDDPIVMSKMGDSIKMERIMLLAGDPWINGSVNMMQGKVDMSFRLKGSKDSGKVYFTSIRRDQSQPYETLRFLIILDSNKETISLLND